MDTIDHAEKPSHDDRLADVLEKFLAATEHGEPVSRSALLLQHPDLAEELAACLDTLDFIGNSLGAGPATAVLECGQQFGEYQILREIGRGGMGVVYEAFHLGLERRVALKVLSGRKFEDEAYRDRFLQEAKTAASLHHTNIVPIFEVGELDGVCYYAMQFIAGQSLGAIVRGLRGTGRAAQRRDMTFFPPGTIVRDERRNTGVPEPPTGISGMASDISATGGSNAPPSPHGSAPLAGGPTDEAYFREAARIIVQAAEALAHAHAHNVVHRDIKPSNLLLDGEGRVWITDFGLAFRADGSDRNSGGDAVGTPAYMSPEQVRPGTPVDHRTDIYSLGATLYELLTLRPLFEGDTSLAIFTKISAMVPAAARSVNPLVPRDLECIARRATAKAPHDRYRDAAEMADDLRRFLERRPIGARYVSPVERLVLWCKREPQLAGVTTAAAVILAIVSIVSYGRILRENRRVIEAKQATEKQLRLTTDAEALARANLWDAKYQQARATLLTFTPARRWTALKLVAEARVLEPDRARRPNPVLDLRDVAISALATRDVRLHRSIAVNDSVDFVGFSPSGQLIGASRTGALQLVDLESGGAPTTLAPAVHEPAWSAPPVALSGRLLAMSSRDGAIDLWDVEARELIGQLEPSTFRIRSLFFVHDPTELVAIAEDGDCRRWQIDSGGMRELPGRQFGRIAHATPGPGTREITIATREGDLEVYGLESDQRRPFADGLPLKGRTTNLLWDSAGRLLGAGRWSGAVELLVAGETHSVQTLGGHGRGARAMAYNPAGTVLAASGFMLPKLKLWDVRTGDPLASLDEPTGGVHAAAFSADGRFVAAGGSDRKIWVWELVAPQSHRRLVGHEAAVTRVAVSPDGKRAVTGDADGSVLAWSLDTDAEPRALVAKARDAEEDSSDLSCTGISISSNSRLVAARFRNGTIQVWDLETGEEVASRRTGRQNAGSGGIEFLPNSNDLVRAVDREIHRWTFGPDDRPNVVARTAQPIMNSSLSRDGRRIAVTTWGRAGNRVEVFDVATGEPVRAPLVLRNQIGAVALSSDGKLLAAGDSRGNVQLVDLESGSRIVTWQELDERIASLSFSADGQWLVVATRDGNVRLRWGRNGELVANLPGHVGGAAAAVFGTTDHTLATCGEDKVVQVWQLDSLNDELGELDLGW